MANESFNTIGSSRTSISMPHSYSDPVGDLITKLAKFVDYKKLMKSDQIINLEKIRSNYKRSDILIAENIDKILSEVKCKTCKEAFIVKHSCGSFICKKCVIDNSFVCTQCNKPLSHKMVRKLYNRSLSCVICGGHTEASCGHFCRSCVLGQEVLELKEGCKVCYNYFDIVLEEPHPCSVCKHYYKARMLIEFCPNHLLCMNCGYEQIESGRCICKVILSVSKVQKIFNRTHSVCKNCNFCFPVIDSKKSECCGKELCPVCIKLTCISCLNPTFNN